MDEPRFTLHRRAFFKFQALTPEEREVVRTKVAGIAELPVERWPAAGARRLPGEEPVYLVVVDDSWRAFLRPVVGGQPEVLDLVRNETLQMFAQQPS